MSLVLILFFLAGRLCWFHVEVTRLTYFLQHFLGFWCFKCRVWSLVRCSLSIFFNSAGGRPRCSNYEFVLERIRFTLSECGNVKSCTLNVSNKWIIFMLSCRAVFRLEFCFSRLPQMAASKNCSKNCFQYLSAKSSLVWLWTQPITRHEAACVKVFWRRTIEAFSFLAEPHTVTVHRPPVRPHHRETNVRSHTF